MNIEIRKGDTFRDEHGTWVVDRHAYGTVNMFEIHLRERGPGHCKLEDGAALLRYYTRLGRKAS